MSRLLCRYFSHEESSFVPIKSEHSQKPKPSIQEFIRQNWNLQEMTVYSNILGLSLFLVKICSERHLG